MTTSSRLDPNQLLDGSPDRSLRRATLAAMGCHERPARLARLRAYGPDIATALRDFALRNRVGPIVALALEEAFPHGYPGRAEWRAIYDAEDRRMGVLLDRLDTVAARLAPEGIAMVALKNAGIARGIYPYRGACPMGDLDVLVDKDRFREAHALILESGFRLAARGTVERADLEEGIAHGGTEYVGEFGGEEVWFELQWRPVAGRWIRRDQEPDCKDLIARSVPISGTDVRLLSPTDNMLQVALHTAKHTYVRAPGLRLHTDVDRLSAYAPPDWDAFIGLAKSLEVKTAVYFSLALAAALLDSPVPDGVLGALQPEDFRRDAILGILKKVDLFEPEQAKFTRPEMIVFTALLYDDARGLLASALDARPEDLKWSEAPRLAGAGLRRVKDLLTRYQR